MARVSLFANTGLDTVNVIDDINYLKTSTALFDTIDDCNIIQSDGLTYVTVKGISSEDAETIDCLIVESNQGNERLYNVIGIEMVATNTCQFKLVPEALASILPDAVVISASANRMHVNDDDEKYYTLLEPFMPSLEPNILQTKMDVRFPNNNYIPILETVTIPPLIFKIEESNIETSSGHYVYNTINGTYDLTDKKFISESMRSNAIPTVPNTTQILDTYGNVTQVTVSSSDNPLFRTMVETLYTIVGLFNKLVTTISTGSRWWLGTELVDTQVKTDKGIDSSVINDLRELGADNNITAYWSVPSVYVSLGTHSGYRCTENSAPNYGGITNISNTQFTADFPMQSSIARLKNNKGKYAQTMTITVFSPISGQSITKQPYEISNPDNEPGEDNIIASYSISADIRPDGYPIFAWRYRNGWDSSDTIPESINGGTWRHTPITGEGASGSYLTEKQIQMSQEKARRTMVAGLAMSAATIGIGVATGGLGMGALGMGGIAGAGTMMANLMNPGGTDAGYISAGNSLVRGGMAGIRGGIGSGIGSVASYILATADQQAQQSLLNQQGAIAFTSTTLSASNFLRDSGNNTFYAYFTQWKEEDVRQFDEFLTLYGYNVGNKKFIRDDFYSREHFNYVRLNNITWKTDNCSKALRQLAEQELKMGVRIWHELPSRGAIEDGNPVV